MNNALFIISLQHELSMAIGNDLDLKIMLKHFIKICFNRLNLTSAHVYIDKNKNAISINNNNKKEINARHFLSIPKKSPTGEWKNNSLLSKFSRQLNQSQKILTTKSEKNYYLTGFIIPKHGVIIFESKFILNNTIQKALKPIFEKLASSCYSSLLHDSLLDEVIARKNIESKMLYQAKHDGLTGLFNRQHLNDLIKESFSSSIKNNCFSSLVFLDLNRFKPINDAMGHAVGDAILINLAERLSQLSRDNIMVARFGGDEFIVLVSNLDQQRQRSIEQVKLIITKINNYLTSPFIIASGSYKLSCSIGYVLFPDPTIKTDDLIKYADLAMYEAKRNKILDGLIYQPYMSERNDRRLACAEEMKEALKQKSFVLYYQAQYNYHGEIIGAEALLRWPHSSRSMESPGVYIPIAEESDLILNIGQMVLEQACQHIQLLEKMKLPDSFKKISINISAKQLIQRDFKQRILECIEENNISAKHLSLEITENLLVESFDRSIKLIEELKTCGVDCCIDDFGTGYSSLTYLKKIPASLLKIDRSFVTNIDQESDSAAIASMIIGLGNILNMGVLAEGVETEAELECLKSLGCNQYQGYYFSKPVAFEEFLSLISL